MPAAAPSTTELTALVGGRLVRAGAVETGDAVVCEGGRIAAVLPAGELHRYGERLRRVDVGGRLVTPGLIDLHIHGAGGHAFSELDDGAYDAMLAFLARHGVTAVQASMASAPLAEHERQLSYVRERLAGRGAAADGGGRDAGWGAGGDGRGARLLGVHLEGPFLAVEQCGAHDPRMLRAPGPGDADRLLESGAMTMLTLAPELPGAIELTERLAAAGVVVAVGHSAARVDDLAAARDAGARHLTHLWSGMSLLTREGPWRVPGLIDASLASDGMTAEIIADGKHLPATLLTLARRCLGDQLCVVSDATSGTGLPEGTRYQVGRVECEVRDGVGVVIGQDAFGGSVTPVNRMLAHLVRGLGWPVPEAVLMATRRPAQVAGVADRLGSLQPGYGADIAVFEDDFTAWATMVAGTWVHGPPAAPAR